MDTTFISILRCPITGQDLYLAQDGIIQTADGHHQYQVRDEIYDFLGEEKAGDSILRDEKQVVKNFYESYGWEKTNEGLYKDSVSFAALSDIAREYTRQCNLRVLDQFKHGGKYFLDAGSGAIPWPEYLLFDKGFEVRICVDLSRAALMEAKCKLGERGRYILADLTNLPLKDGTVDAATANHVFYHIPADEQPKAFTELARVLSAGSKATVIYAWSHSPLAWRLSKIFNVLSSGKILTETATAPECEAVPTLYYHPHSLEWFQTQPWPFKYELLPFRLVDNSIMKRYFHDTVLWRIVIKGLLLFQSILPNYSGKYGKYPMIVLHSYVDN